MNHIRLYGRRNLPSMYAMSRYACLTLIHGLSMIFFFNILSVCWLFFVLYVLCCVCVQHARVGWNSECYIQLHFLYQVKIWTTSVSQCFFVVFAERRPRSTWDSPTIYQAYHSLSISTFCLRMVSGASAHSCIKCWLLTILRIIHSNVHKNLSRIGFLKVLTIFWPWS